ncbi:hypothetical protein Tco_0642654 [Tanacetum coccineum]
MCVAQVAQPQVNPDSTIAQELHTVQRGRVYDKGHKAEQNKLKSWKIGEIRDKEVNQAARDCDDALVCCVENTVEDRIMDYGASFHDTYCKEELERFKLRSGKVRLADDKTLDIAGVGDVVLKTSFGTSWTLKDVRIGMNMLASKGNVLDVRKVDIYFCKPDGLGKQKNISFIMSVKTRKLQSRSCDRYNANLQFGVAERLSRTFRAESTGIRVEASKMLWADLVSTSYLIYRIPYVLIGLRIPEEECGSYEMRYNFRDTKSHQVIRSRDITFVDSIYEARAQVGAQIRVRVGSGNSESFKDSGRSDEEYSEDGASSKEGGSETPHVRRSTRESRDPVRDSPSGNYLLLTENGEPESYSEALIRISAGKKESQRLWMFKVKEEQNSRKRYKARLEPSYVGALNDTSTQHKREGFQLAGQEENLEYRLKEIMYGLIQAPRLRDLKFDSFMQRALTWQFPLVFEMKDRCYEKQVLGYVLTVGVTIVEWESRLQKSITMLSVNYRNWAKLVRILISEGSLSLLKILRTKSLAAMFTRLVMKEKLKFYAASTGLRVN